MRIKSPFRYPGSKNRLSINKIILSYFPENITEYREPFAGSGGIYFSQNKYKKRWINDINEDLMSVYNELLSNTKQFINQCRSIPTIIESKDKEKTQNIIEKKFYELLESENSALRYFFLNRTCFSGRVRKKLTYFSYAEGWNITRNNGHLERIAEYMKDTIITNTDYNVLLENLGDNVFLYLDPVYYSDTQRRNSSKLYDFSFTEQDHLSLYNNLKKCKHKWCMSYDGHDFIRDLYKDFNIYNEKWTYNFSTENRKKGDEIIITNY